MPQQLIDFRYPAKGNGRPQIVLVGNGLELFSGLPGWDELVHSLEAPGCVCLSKEERNTLPFPLLYEMLSLPTPAPSTMTPEMIHEQGRRLSVAMERLCHISNPFLDRLPELNADHIFTTNYSYCVEKAFFPECDFSKPHVRTKYRFTTRSDGKREIYRINSGYHDEKDKKPPVYLWHIHGECSDSRSVVLGNDRYGRLLSRMEDVCKRQSYKNAPSCRSFGSWPELFLYGDVYIIGLGFWTCEYDLWWLLRRKQREYYSDGKAYYYTPPCERDQTSCLRNKLMEAHGAQICHAGAAADTGYEDFYNLALDEIARSIAEKRHPCHRHNI